MIKKPVFTLTLIVDGNCENKNLELCGVSEQSITSALNKNGIKSCKEVLYMDVRQDGVAYLAKKKGKVINLKLKVNGENW